MRSRNVVGAMWLAAVVGLVSPPAGAQGVELQGLFASNGDPQDQFGIRVDIDGQRAVIGAWGDDDLGTDAGAAYVFKFDPATGQWVEEQKLKASNGLAGDNFGVGVAIWGDVIVVGARYHDTNPYTNDGGAYVFEWDGSSWVQVAFLRGSQVVTGDEFGFAVAVDGSTIAVGAHLADQDKVDSGAVYVFAWSSLFGWQEVALLKDPNAVMGDELGRSVAISGDVLVAGAWLADHSGFIDAGKALAFRDQGGTWGSKQVLWPSGAAASNYDNFGVDVSVDGEVLIVGSRSDDPIATDSGAAYVFRFDGVQWLEEQRLFPGNGAAYDNFGTGVAIQGSAAFIGAWGADRPAAGSGVLYGFRRCKNGTWVEDQELAPLGRLSGDSLGVDVAVSGSRVLCGAHGDDTAKGGAYLFGAEDLELLAWPTTVPSGQQVTFTSFYGIPSSPALFAITAFDTISSFQVLLVSRFAGDHRFALSGINDPLLMLGGHELCFQTYEINACGNVVASNVACVQFQ